MGSQDSIIALLHGPDQPGLVAKVSNWIWERQGNILHADQHRDSSLEIFFQRVEWIPRTALLDAEIREFREFASELQMQSRVVASSQRSKVAMLVSRYDHCFHDLILRWKAGEFNGDICCVISNHEHLRSAAEAYGLPFHCVPVTRADKQAAEAEQLELLARYGADLIIMARYMQVLSSGFLASWQRPVINVHHSFLPAFAGAKPYHQAHSRGVKLIGATAHYATADLDEGPIITQAVTAVNHRHTVEDLVRKGRDLEKVVLSQAMRFHLQQRILCYGNKTVVFD
ncbi:MAG: formyltetrahydrofolate deformylase [Puniceicoccaceae bacterium]